MSIVQQKPYIVVVTPGVIDQLHFAKRELVTSLCDRLAIRAVYDDYKPVAPEFAIEATKALLLNSALVLVDLSYERPSCYFELGMTEALGVRAGVVAQRGTPIHQTSYRDAVRYFLDIREYELIVSDVLSHVAAKKV